MSTLTDPQVLEFLSRLFPGGLGDAELLVEICPQGWENSPLRLVFHPEPERRYEEHCGFLKNMARLLPATEAGKPVPTYEEFLADEKHDRRSLGGPLDEWTQLLGDCLWDLLANGHEVILASGERVNFGSFRTVSALIDEFIEGGPLSEDWDWGDSTRFYMGTSMIADRTDFRPVYRLIFNRLGSLGFRWYYSFPRIYAFRFEKPEEAVDYDVSTGFATEQERRKQEEEHRRFQEGLEADVAEAKRQAWDQAPPAVVQAYQEVFGEDPSGWPPDLERG